MNDIVIPQETMNRYYTEDQAFEDYMLILKEHAAQTKALFLKTLFVIGSILPKIPL